MPEEAKPRVSGKLLVPFRILLITILFTLMAFVISLFLGIIGVVIWAEIRGIHPDMTMAYREIAPPIAIIVGSFVFISAIFVEIRDHRQAKVLAGIERAS